ncbi:PREDICTED: DNA dC-_dU-editing enzyme APOBEC-3G-like, partial [Myotis brandtii]|uniref:DNA dC->dU-editing enzyme APOBEC-3G-like n=1 Tax=Myotis brandtii TaxID=109478 RepID=UPI0007047A3F
TLIDATTFEENFANRWDNETQLCYEVEVWKHDAWAPLEKYQGSLCNQGSRHAEFCFLDLVSLWPLDKGKQYRLTWYISWSPSYHCAQKLVKFLGEKSNVRLRIFAAGISEIVSRFEDGLRDLRDAGAELAIMTLTEYEHCWDTFVDNQGQPFHPWTELEKNIGAQCQRLENILRNQGN